MNSTGIGARLIASGTSSVAGDDLILHVSQARANAFGMFLQGTNLIGAPFKDGILCAGSPTRRLGVFQLDAEGGADSSAISVVTAGNVSPGQTRYYQCWFRDGHGASVCGYDSNLSGAVQVDWQ